MPGEVLQRTRETLRRARKIAASGIEQAKTVRGQQLMTVETQ